MTLDQTEVLLILTTVSDFIQLVCKYPELWV